MAARPLVLRHARILSTDGVREGDLHLRNGRIASGPESTSASDEFEIDLDGLLIAPGLCDADHALDQDFLPPIFPGPYLDRDRREAEIEKESMNQPPEAKRADEDESFRAAALASLKEGVTCVASPRRPVGPTFPIRIPQAVWFSSLVAEKHPSHKFAKAENRPVFAPLADGDSRDCARETERFTEYGMLRDNLLAIGGVGLRPADAAALAFVGASLVWRPVTDEFVLGRTVGSDVLRAENLRVLLGAGSRRDGGKGLLAALRRADRLGHIDRARLLRAVTSDAGEAFRLPVGVIRKSAWADLAVWRANNLAEAIFELGPAALEMTIAGGAVVLCRSSWASKLAFFEDLRPDSGDGGFFSVI